MVDETATLTESPAESPKESLAADAALEAAPLEEQPKPDEPVTQTEGDDSGAEKPEEAPPRPWAEVETTDALFEHESVAPILSERLDVAREEGQKTGQSDALARLQPLHDKNLGTLTAIAEGVDAVQNGLRRMVRAGLIEENQLNDLMEDHKGAFEGMRGVHQEIGKWSGANGVISGLAQALNSTEFRSEFTTRLGSMERGLADEKVWPDIVKAISDAVVKPLKTEIKELKAKAERVEVEHRAAARSETKPPADVAGAGAAGAKSDREKMLDPNTPVTELQAIRARQMGLTG